MKKITVCGHFENLLLPFLALRLNSKVQLYSQMQMCESRRPHNAEQKVYVEAAVTWPSVGSLLCTRIYPKGMRKGWC